MTSPINRSRTSCCSFYFSSCISSVKTRFFSFFQRPGEANILNPEEVQPLIPSHSRATELFIENPPLIIRDAHDSPPAMRRLEVEKPDSAKTEDNLSLPSNYEADLIDLINHEDTIFHPPVDGGGGGPSLFVEDKFFVKFEFKSKELFGNILFRRFGEKVPETAPLLLGKKIINDIIRKSSSRWPDFAKGLRELLGKNENLRVLLMPRIEGKNLRELNKLSAFTSDNSDILFLVSELGRIALKDLVCRVGDRMIDQVNPGNVMIAYNEDLTNQRLLLIDNVFGFHFSRNHTRQMDKNGLSNCIKNGVINILSGCKGSENVSEIPGFDEAVNKGIQQGLKELKENLDGVHKAIEDMERIMNDKWVATLTFERFFKNDLESGLKREIEEDVQMLLSKYEYL